MHRQVHGIPRAAVDWVALRLRRIEQRLEQVQFALELQARRYVAVLVVALTLAGGAAYSGLSGQVSPPVAISASAATSLVVVLQIRALGILATAWDRECRYADDAMEILMRSQENNRHDG